MAQEPEQIYCHAVRRVLLLWVLLGACEAENPRNCANGVCEDPDFPFCDIDGAIAGNPHTCIAPSCTPSLPTACQGESSIVCDEQGTGFTSIPCEHGCNRDTFVCNHCTPDAVECVGSSLVTCGPDGDVAQTVSCVAGCGASPEAHCVHIVPKYIPTACDVPTSNSPIDVMGAGMFDTDLSSNCTGGVVVQTGGPELCVVRHSTVTIHASAMMRFIGSRAVALVSDGDLTVDGTVDVSARMDKNGPGGGTTASGGVSNTPNGWGGAGFHTAGGSGGSSTTNGGAGNAGGTSVDPATLTVLVGGPVDGFTMSPSSGGGGGALTLISCRGAVVVSGTINAGGGGGYGGGILLAMLLGGSGGGAGGNVVLQGLDVRVTGRLFANGGSGGAGKPTNQATGANGFDGNAGVMPSPGGAATGTGEGVGGTGGYLNLPGGAGGRYTGAGTSAGGGGGGVGFFQSYTPSNRAAVLTPAEASPAPQPNGTIEAR